MYLPYEECHTILGVTEASISSDYWENGCSPTVESGIESSSMYTSYFQSVDQQLVVVFTTTNAVTSHHSCGCTHVDGVDLTDDSNTRTTTADIVNVLSNATTCEYCLSLQLRRVNPTSWSSAACFRANPSVLLAIGVSTCWP